VGALVGTGVRDGEGVGRGVGVGFGGVGVCVACWELDAAQAGTLALRNADDGAKHSARSAINPTPSRGTSLDPIGLILGGTIPAWTAARQSVHTGG